MLVAYLLLYPKNDESLIIIEDFYSLEENSLDVIFLGSSRNIMNINPAEIWQTGRLSSFALGATGQPLWNSYHYLSEALKTQSPQLIVLEVGMLSFPEEYSEYNFIVKNTLGLKQNVNRYEAIQTSAPEEIRTDLLLKFPVFHDRYDELTVTDFTFGMVDRDVSYRGFTPSGTQVSYDIPEDLSGNSDYVIPDKNLLYLQMIIELCSENDIELLLLATPDLITEPTGWSEMCASISHEVQEIADLADINYLNTDDVGLDIGLDYSSDFRDERHLNIYGAKKLSQYLAEYIIESYEIFTVTPNPESWDSWSANTNTTLYD